MNSITLTEDDLQKLVEKITRNVIEKLRPDIIKEDIIDTDGACKMLHVCESTLYRWEQEQYLTPVRIGRRKFFLVSDIHKLMIKPEPAVQETKPRYVEAELFGEIENQLQTN